MKKWTIILIALLVLLVAGLILGKKVWGWIYSSNTALDKPYSLYIPHDTSISHVAEAFRRDSVLLDIETFEAVAGQKKMERVKSGHYLITPGMSNNEMANILRSGLQSPVKLTFIAQNDLRRLSGVLSSQMAFDSASFYLFVENDFPEQYDIRQEHIPAYFLPNTYEVYWNESPSRICERMMNEYEVFWNESRLGKAHAKGLSSIEVSILASIVEGETNKVDEMPTVAGLYLNRIRKGMKLESDPTIRFCIKQEKGPDYVVRRVLNKDLKIDSPYNTYMYKGLPPGPISIPSLQAVNAVLNAESNNYIFMCADPETGYHLFTNSYQQHLRNRKKYTDWLKERNIRR